MAAPDAARWFACPACDHVVTGLVRGTGPKHTEELSRTHCCHRCESGRGHDPYWCSGMPATALRQVRLPTGETAHCVVHEPIWSEVEAPVPAVLWLHGAMTYIWPETLYKDLRRCVDANAVARRMLIVAPLATCGEPLAVVSETRRKENRYGVEEPYVDSFDADRTWSAFLAVCHALGPERVDFGRLCVTGLSMGAQAAWDIALAHGPSIAALAPIAGRCAWPADAWGDVERHSERLRRLPIRAFSVGEDRYSYSWRDFEWLAGVREAGGPPTLRPVDLDAGAAHTHSWSETLQLTLFYGHRDNHNCWDMVYEQEGIFGLFGWMSGCACARGHALFEMSSM